MTRSNRWSTGRLRAIGFLLPLIFLFLSCELINPSDEEIDWPELKLTLITGDLIYPTSMAHANDGSGRMFVAEKLGRVMIVKDGVYNTDPFLNISDRVSDVGLEAGLLDVTFSPDYSTSGIFYVYYVNKDGDTVISKFRVSDDPDYADEDLEEIILQFGRYSQNHFGGEMEFGSEGYLYVSVGDGSPDEPGDEFLVAQNKASLLGKMLRIDVTGQTTYAIPPENPFVNDADALGEIWALGLRNPWRFSFDSANGDLYIADVGAHFSEAIYYEAAGGAGGHNYGWSVLEGTSCYKPELDCGQEGFTDPILEFPHNEVDAIIGGYVYRGPANCRMQGKYFFADWTGRILAMEKNGSDWEYQILVDLMANPIEDYIARQASENNTEPLADSLEHIEYITSSFGMDEEGALYVVIYSIFNMPYGALYKITDPSGSQSC